MAGYKLLRRLEIIIHILDAYPYTSKEDLKHKLERDYELQLTNRTLERDFKALETDFSIGLQYDASKNGYVLDKQDRKRIQSFFKYVELVHLGELFKESLEDFELLREKVVLEDSAKFKGIQHIKPLLLAIKKRKAIAFVYENYTHKTLNSYKIFPLQIREYANRWYVIGVPRGEDHIRTFGLDRMQQLQSKEEVHHHLESYETQLQKFHSVVGLNYNAAEKVERVLLAVTLRQFKYLNSLPLHHSQFLAHKREDGRMELSYHVIPNYELKMQLLKMGPEIEILQPSWLRKEIKTSLQDNLKQYKHEK
ncbi:helix-turn-helix transcriptional regulator [Mesonia ostreae]|uniref:WYL domain-containing protein n=1 Tax=Mesonia ostreae TaxID=861110 RepID=A0ABU2KIA4_9FLAO|nr:WYL domain-containing protein [Mesonia ostreae]MDT0294446.1 WYL domain-containing protein [Mesonia ostreae]